MYSNLKIKTSWTILILFKINCRSKKIVTNELFKIYHEELDTSSKANFENLLGLIVNERSLLDPVRTEK